LPSALESELQEEDAAKAIEKATGIQAASLVQAIKEGTAAEKIKELLNMGTAIQGSAYKALKDGCKKLNLDIHIQDKKWVVTKRGKPLQTTAVLLSPATGLIGSPEKTRLHKRTIVKVKSLLIPGLLPKRMVNIKSALVSGTFVIYKGQYKGDTNGNDWYADLECIAV
jgi:hypothetical protein